MQNDLYDILDTLLAIKDKFKNGEPCYTGICAQYKSYGNRQQASLEPYFKTWVHFSGSLEYPVPSGTSESPDDAYDNSRDKMFSKSTRYGRLRHNLLNHCIREVRREIKESYF